MSKRNLPMLPQPDARHPSRLAPVALERWNAGLVATESDNTISILDPIGPDMWTGEGVTAKRISAALRSIGARDVIVNMNSPGGDFFEGVSIYNLLREHPHNVTVRVLGVAASAASVIAMAGDEIQVAKAGSLMIHNTMMIAFGNRNALREVAAIMEKFDGVMAELYADRTGLAPDEIEAMLDAETWMTGQEAVDQGFADALLPADQVKEKKRADVANAAALQRIEAALMVSGMPRSERRALLREVTGKPSAAEPMPSAGEEVSKEMHRITADFQAIAANPFNNQ
jgi:ATP-dependent Clp protease, protease subunit